MDSAISKFIDQIDYAPTNIKKHPGAANNCILEDSEPTIKMCIKQRWPTLRYVPRTHRIDLDFLFERIATDPGIRMRYINSVKQLADILTKGCLQPCNSMRCPNHACLLLSLYHHLRTRP